MSAPDLSGLSMMELFRLDAEGQVQALTAGLLALEQDATASAPLESCMRAAHSLKGAARLVGIQIGVQVAHALEDCFVAAQKGSIVLRHDQIDVLLRGVDLLHRLANTADERILGWSQEQEAAVEELLSSLAGVLQSREAHAAAPAAEVRSAAVPATQDGTPAQAAPAAEREAGDRVLRVSADHLNRLLGLAGESMVESRRLKPFAQLLLRLKRMHGDGERRLEVLQGALTDHGLDERSAAALAELRQSLDECRRFLSQRILEFEMFDSRSSSLGHRLYESALACRMRPFADGVKALPRLVRDTARMLGKQARLEILGEATHVDRDILARLEAPLGHLLRNALDHGIEPPGERDAAGKPAAGVVRVEARHSAGVLQILVSDDGRGVDVEKLRRRIVTRALTTADIAARLSEPELLEFLFLPGFSLADTVTELSGRGVGLDVVQDMMKEVRGSIRISSQPGKGTNFQMQLPLTLSVVRTLLVQIGGEPYAFPLANIVQTLKFPRGDIQQLEGREHVQFEGKTIGLVSAQQLFGSSAARAQDGEVAVILLGGTADPYGLVVERFLGERELVVHPIDPRFGKIRDIASAALMEDGSPVLIVDVEDLLHSIDKLVSAGRLHKLDHAPGGAESTPRKRVLVVEDSLTVRELERKMLDQAGYEVEVAVDGMEGWNAARDGRFDLVITDIDMPRLDGIELVRLIKKEPRLNSLPVMIVSYKDRAEDRQRGLDAGADYYLTKGSFHDDSLLRAVADLIGGAEA